jgi:hypothetical protein
VSLSSSLPSAVASVLAQVWRREHDVCPSEGEHSDRLAPFVEERNEAVLSSGGDRLLDEGPISVSPSQMLLEKAIRDVPCAESKPLLEREPLVWRLREGFIGQLHQRAKARLRGNGGIVEEQRHSLGFLVRG